MKRTFLLLGLVLSAFALFGQSGTSGTRGAPAAPATFTLTINVSPANANAQIFVDNAEIKGNAATIQGGNRAIRVTANGYQDFNTTVNVTGNMTVPVTLQPRTANLTINVSPANIGARIFVDNAEIRGNTATVALGNRAIRVTANGYVDFSTIVNVTGNISVPVVLQAQTANLTINVTPANIGAQIFVDNAEIKGNVATVQLGNRNIKVTAPGYIDFSSTVNVTGNTTVPVSLQPRTANLTFNVSPANIGAQIFVDNVEIKGNVATVQLGNRSIRVSAPNYIDFTSTINVTGNTTVPVSLQPANATVNINVSANYQAKELGNRFFAQLTIYVDGQRQNMPANSTSLSIPAGQRTIRIVSGGMQSEISFNFLPGKNYTVEPVFTIMVKE